MKPKAADFTREVQRVLRSSIADFKCLFICADPYAEKESLEFWAMESFERANKQVRPDMPPFECCDEIIAVVSRR
jgi:hypothetical protein